MGKKLIREKKLVGKGVKKRRMLPAEKKLFKESMAKIKPHYSKPVLLRADFEADFPDRKYYVKQIYSPDDTKENPLMSSWNRAEHLNSVGYDFGRPYLVTMTPQEFLDLNPSPWMKGTEPGALSKEKLKDIRAEMKAGKWEPRNMTNEGPFMDIGVDSIVETHEGRHRAIVLKEMGVKEMPVLIYDRTQRNERWQEKEPWMVDEVQRTRERKRIERELKQRRRRLGMD